MVRAGDEERHGRARKGVATKRSIIAEPDFTSDCAGSDVDGGEEKEKDRGKERVFKVRR